MRSEFTVARPARDHFFIISADAVAVAEHDHVLLRATDCVRIEKFYRN